jgi:uncharacterized protein (UPF0332 family)
VAGSYGAKCRRSRIYLRACLMAGAPFNWAEYLRLATDLSQNPDEASHRTSISRAYYSIYHAASEVAIRNGYPSGSNSHAGLWKVFSKDADRDCRRLATLANTMMFARKNADYKSTFPRVADQMAQQLTNANSFMARLGLLPPNLPRP